MLNRIRKKLFSGIVSHFFHFFAVFTGIFLVMTVIILQIMRYGLYSSVDSALKMAVDNADNYIIRTMDRTSSITVDDSGEAVDSEDKETKDTKGSTDKKPSDAGTALSNVDVILYDEDGIVLNSIDTFIQFGTISPSLDSGSLGEISEETLTTIFGLKEKYHTVTVEISSETYPDVKYATFLVSVDQLDESSDRYQTITITIMTLFWLISILASVYLANWSRKPIMESFEKQKSFVENASHELRTPLAVLQNRLESLFRKPNETILENSESIAASLDEVRNMRLLTMNLLNLARRDDGLLVEATDIDASTFDEIFENYALIAEENGKVFNSYNRVSSTIHSDKTLLKQLLTILFDNAIKYTDDDGVIDFTIETTDKHIILSVEDNGLGISDTDKKKIFDRFYRVDKARTRQTGGFGLGLSLAQQIVQALKGSVVAKDNQPKGTIFEVKLTKTLESRSKLLN